MTAWSRGGAGEFGGDVSHLNLTKPLHPHGGAARRRPGLRGGRPRAIPAGPQVGGLPARAVGAVSAAPLGNAAVLPISWMYCRMMGAEGLTQATEVAILSANYISARLRDHYPTLYASENGHVAHECILDLRPLKDASGVSAEDVAKRLIDYGFHAPPQLPVPDFMVSRLRANAGESTDSSRDIAIRESRSSIVANCRMTTPLSTRRTPRALLTGE